MSSLVFRLGLRMENARLDLRDLWADVSLLLEFGVRRW